MSDILFQYEKVNPTSWAYLSSILMIALFFKFNRFFSVRNVDLVMLILFAPGLLLVQFAFENTDNQEIALAAQRLGFLWLFLGGAAWIARLLLDSAMTRRPLLAPNLNVAGLGFLGGALLFFLLTNVVTGKISKEDQALGQRPVAADAQPDSERSPPANPGSFETQGPGYWLLYLLPRISTQRVIAGGNQEPPDTQAKQAAQEELVRQATTRVMAILSLVLIVLGLVLVGARHYENATAGVAAGTMYLLLPYTALWTGSVPHALPGALLVWAVVLYRRPLWAGMLVGLASGTIFYPAFLMPLWCSFYWDRGVKRFVTGVLLTLGGLVVSLAFTAGSLDGFLESVRQMFGIYIPRTQDVEGIWQFWRPAYRLPILALFVVLSLVFAAWPIRKHLGTLISGTAALMLGTQLWHAHEGGLYMAWYLPLLLLTIYRPNLEDRVALTVVQEGWWQRRQRALADGGP
jgi:hypothetical protein